MKQLLGFLLLALLMQTAVAKPVLLIRPLPSTEATQVLFGTTTVQVTYQVVNNSSLPIPDLQIKTTSPLTTLVNETCSTTNPLAAGQACTVTLNMDISGVDCKGFIASCFFKVPPIEAIAFNGYICSITDKANIIKGEIVKALISLSTDPAEKHTALRAAKITVGNMPVTLDALTLSTNLTDKVSLCSTTANSQPYLTGTPPTQNPAYCGMSSTHSVGDIIPANTTATLWLRSLDNPDTEDLTSGTINITAGMQTKRISVNYRRELYVGGSNFRLPTNNAAVTPLVRLRDGVWEDVPADAPLTTLNNEVRDIILDNTGDIIIGGILSEGDLHSIARLNCGTNQWEPVQPEGLSPDSLVFNGPVNSLILDTTGRLFAAGMFDRLTGSSTTNIRNIAQLTAFGWIAAAPGIGALGKDDLEFPSGTFINDMIIDGNGALVAAGNFRGGSTASIARLVLGANLLSNNWVPVIIVSQGFAISDFQLIPIGSQVKALALNPRDNNNLIAVGDFTVSGPTTFTYNGAATISSLFNGWVPLFRGFPSSPITDTNITLTGLPGGGSINSYLAKNTGAETGSQIGGHFISNTGGDNSLVNLGIIRLTQGATVAPTYTQMVTGDNTLQPASTDPGLFDSVTAPEQEINDMLFNSRSQTIILGNFDSKGLPRYVARSAGDLTADSTVNSAAGPWTPLAPFNTMTGISGNSDANVFPGSPPSPINAVVGKFLPSLDLRMDCP